MMVLTRERRARGWSRAELGRRASIHPARVGQTENRRVIPYDVELRRMADALGWQGELAGLLVEADCEPSGA